MKKGLFIDGVWCESKEGKKREIIDPARGQVTDSVSEASEQDCKRALVAARKSFDFGPWQDTSYEERSQILKEIAKRIYQNKKKFAELETLDTGKTLTESLWDIDDVVGVFEYYAKLILQLKNEELKSPNEGTTSIKHYESLGVCCLILPWNYPLLQCSWKLAPAVAAGCTFVMKPSELTPLSTLFLVELIEDLFPKGVLNLVLGGPEVGKILSEWDQVDLVSFTGSLATGKKIMAAASQNLTKVALELGGKNPHLIFDDAPLETAVDYALNAVFFHAGQICSAGSRLLLHESIHDDFVLKLKERMKKIRVGPGHSEATQMGPLISREQLEKVDAYVKLGQEEGAELLLGGGPPKGGNYDPKGFFYEPTLLINCHSSMRVVQEEIFGPVITVEKFSSDKEALELANGTEYGLSAGFWTRSQDRVEKFSKKLRFGTVWINDYNVYFPEAPWGGYKRSGIGRELGKEGLHEYMEIKHTYQNHKPQPLNYF